MKCDPWLINGNSTLLIIYSIWLININRSFSEFCIAIKEESSHCAFHCKCLLLFVAVIVVVLSFFLFSFWTSCFIYLPFLQVKPTFFVNYGTSIAHPFLQLPITQIAFKNNVYRTVPSLSSNLADPRSHLVLPVYGNPGPSLHAG